MALPANIRANMSAPFPSPIVGLGGLKVSKSNGLWRVQADFASLAAYVPPNVNWPNVYFWAYDASANSYSKISLQTIETTVNATAAIEFVIGDGSTALVAGSQADIVVPFDCVITSATLLANTPGNAVIDLWVDTYANFPPTILDTITGATPPTLTAAQKSQDSALVGWTKTLAAGSVIRMNITSVAGLTRLTLSLELNRT